MIFNNFINKIDIACYTSFYNIIFLLNLYISKTEGAIITKKIKKIV